MSLLGIYLNDHRAALLGARELARRAHSAQRDTELGTVLARVIDGVDDDLRLLAEAVRREGVRIDPVKHAAAWLGEKAGRLKLNGHLRTRSPLSTVVELEGLLLALHLDAMALRTLTDLGHPVLAGLPFADARIRVDEHLGSLQRHRDRAAATALAHGRVT